LVWGKAGTTTLTSTQSTIDVSISTSSEFYQIICSTPALGQNSAIRSGNSTIDTGSNYAYRSSRNGISDVAVINNSVGMRVNDNAGNTPNFVIGYMINISDEEKLMPAHAVEQMTAGAGNAPNRNEVCGKHYFVSNLIDIIQMNQDSMASDTNLTILGSDETL
jgi:hypothetical protein